jgi:hypothetical protein
MRFSTAARIALSLAATILTDAQTTTTPGYFTDFSTIPSNSTFSFGTHYAVLNLDLINALVGSINTTTEGMQFINSTCTWINAVHAQTPPPISLFTRIYFSTPLRPEIGPQTPFAAASAGLGNITESSVQGMIYPSFVPKPDYDVVLQKVRYYAGAGNELEEILSSQLIDTVIIVSYGHKSRFFFVHGRSADRS